MLEQTLEFELLTCINMLNKKKKKKKLLSADVNLTEVPQLLLSALSVRVILGMHVFCLLDSDWSTHLPEYPSLCLQLP